mgnify:CR=1 FL=1
MVRQVVLVAFFTTVLIAVLLFALKNNQVVSADLVVHRIDSVPLWAVMVVSFIVGIVFASLFFLFVFLTLYVSYRGAIRELTKARAELDALKSSIPPLERNDRS